MRRCRTPAKSKSAGGCRYMMLPMRPVAATLFCGFLLAGCQPVPMTVLDSNTGDYVTIPPCPDYVRPFKRAVIRWELIQAYVGVEVKIEPGVLTAVRNLGKQHEVEARKLCDSVFGLLEAGRLSAYTCRDAFLRNSARQIEEINMVFEEVSRLKYEDIKKQSGRINELLLDYQKRFLPLGQACGPPGTGPHQQEL